MESLAVEQHTVEHVLRVHVVLWEQQISAALQVWELAGVLVDSTGLARASDPQHTSIAAGLSDRRRHHRWTEADCGPARPSRGSRMGSRALSLCVWTPRDRSDRSAGRALKAAVGSSQVPRRACERVCSGGRVLHEVRPRRVSPDAGFGPVLTTRRGACALTSLRIITELFSPCSAPLGVAQ